MHTVSLKIIIIKKTKICTYVPRQKFGFSVGDSSLSMPMDRAMIGLAINRISTYTWSLGMFRHEKRLTAHPFTIETCIKPKRTKGTNSMSGQADLKQIDIIIDPEAATPSSGQPMIRKKPEIISWKKVRGVSAEFAACRYGESRCGNQQDIECGHPSLLTELIWGVRMRMLTKDEYDQFRAMWQSTMR